MTRRSHHDPVAADRHRGAESIGNPSAERDELLLLRPGSVAPHEDVGRASRVNLIRVENVLESALQTETRLRNAGHHYVVRRPDYGRVAADRDGQAELTRRPRPGGPE